MSFAASVFVQLALLSSLEGRLGKERSFQLLNYALNVVWHIACVPSILCDLFKAYDKPPKILYLESGSATIIICLYPQLNFDILG
eukprot:12881394-Ditylum_brightwellii.AAC.1